MDKKTVLITGSTSGIGKAIAIAYAKLGFNIVFNGLEIDGEIIAQQIADAHKIKHIFSNTNLLDVAAVQQMAATAIHKFGSIDILINNAGIQHVSPIESFADEKWDAIIAINLSAAFHLTKAVWPLMAKNKFGRIINIASAHGLVASPFKSAYIASKHGLIGFTKAMALEGAEHNITCNAICPGYVHTAIIDKQIPDAMKANNMTKQEVIDKVMLAKQAVKEFIDADLIADTCVFLSNESSKTITGISLPIDGGWNAS